jgi:exodeoxyribonuclease-3
LRSAASKGFFAWFRRQKADVLCVQELKASEQQLAAREFGVRGFRCSIHAAQRPGYSGVAIYSRREPSNVLRGFGDAEFDAEGRYLEAHFGSLVVVSTYFPSGSAGPARQAAKFRFLAAFEQRLAALRAAQVPYLFCGDFNIAHKPIDLKNWRANQDYPGFTPEERAWMDALLGAHGYVDAFRVIDQRPDQYTWWSSRGRAREKNVGWRIDYQIVSPALSAAVRRVAVYRRNRFSDHAPLTIDYDWEL